MMDQKTHGQAQPQVAARNGGSAAPSRPPVLDTRQLMQGESLIHIMHEGACYSLRVTRQNRLILTK